MTKPDLAPDGAQAIDRAFALLRLIAARSTEGVSFSHLVAESTLTKPTVHRLVKALERNGFIDHNTATRRYHLGPESVVIGKQASGRYTISQAAAAALARIADVSGDTSFLSIRRDTHALYLERHEGAYPIRTHVVHVGTRHPLGVGAASLAMLATLGDEEIEAIILRIERELLGYYPAFPPDYIRRVVDETRRQDFAFNPGRMLPGSWAVGVAIIDENGSCLGALSISAIESRLGEDRRPGLVDLLHDEAARVASLLARPQPGMNGLSRPGPLSQSRRIA